MIGQPVMKKAAIKQIVAKGSKHYITLYFTL